MDIAYVLLPKVWTKLEDIIGNEFALDEGITYTIEKRGFCSCFISEQNEAPTGECGRSFRKIKITPNGNNFYLKANGVCWINLSCDTLQEKQLTASKPYFNKVMKVGGTKYKCVENEVSAQIDYELHADDITAFNLIESTFAENNLDTGTHVFIASEEEGYLIAETLDREVIILHRDSQYDTEVEFYYTYEQDGEIKRAKMLYEPPVEEDHVYRIDERDEFAYIKYVIPPKTIWYLNDTIVNLADYGITYEGTVNVGDTITVDYVKPKLQYSWTAI